jgi:periplasmic copper chaperone A
MISKVFLRIVFAAGLALLPVCATAHDYRVGTLRIDYPWSIATPNGAKVGAGYMKITNEGAQPDRLIGITSPLAGKVAVHASVREGDIVRMRALDKGLEIRPGETVELKPDGAHVMFEDLRAPLLEAGRVQATLLFEKAGSVDVGFAVEPMGTKAAPPAPAATHNH